MESRPKQLARRFRPITDRLTIDCHDDVTNDCGSHSFIGHREAKFGLIARGVFEDWPDGGANLLALDGSGVTGHEEGRNADQGSDDCFVSAQAPSLVIPHVRDAIWGR